MTTDDAGYCWGWGRYGNLGVGEILDTLIDTLQGAIDTTIQISDSAHKSVPWPVAGGLKFSMITTGGGFACGLTVDGVPYCWGSRLTEPFGFDWSPVLVNATLTFSTITAGAFHVCALAATGEAYCWGGAHFGATEGEGGSALGDGTTEDRATPVPVAGGHLFTSISAGLGYTCGVTTGRELYCWGANPMGELGNGTTTPSTVPVQVTHP